MEGAREKILVKIRQAQGTPTPKPYPNLAEPSTYYNHTEEDLAVLFAHTFTGIQGQFSFCESQQDLIAQLKQLLHSRNWSSIYCAEKQWQSLPELCEVRLSNSLSTCDASITGAEILVARTGSIVLSAAQAEGRTASVYAPIHVCIAQTSQIVYDIKEALAGLKEKYGEDLPSFISFASGPSRTADIEKTLVTGVHGPKEVFLFLLGN